MKIPSTHTAYLPLPRVLLRFLSIVISLWVVSLVFALIRSHPLRSLDGFKWIYYEGAAFDYYDYIGRMYYLHRPEFFSAPGYAWYYPAASVLPLQFFYTIGNLANSWLLGYLSYIAVAVVGTLLAALKLSSAMHKQGVSLVKIRWFLLATCVFSWPIYFSLERGNIEAVTWLILAGAIWAYGEERWIAAAVLLGVVSAFKFYPVLCFALFLKPRRWRELMLGLVVMVATTLAALRYMQPSITLALNGMNSGMAKWINDYALSYGPASATYDHSLYELIKVATILYHPPYVELLHEYMLLAGVVFTWAFFARVIHLPRTNQVLFLISACVYLSPASFDYTLQNLYISFGWLALAQVTSFQSGNPSKALEFTFILLAFTFGPETFLMWHSMTAAGLFKSPLILALILVSVFTALPDVEQPRSQQGVLENQRS